MLYSGNIFGPLPSFDPEGVLPPGDYELTFDQIRESALVWGPGGPSAAGNWDRKWRQVLVANLETLVSQLRQVGIVNIYINGSFVEDKDHPNDIDGYFECDRRRLISGELEALLNECDPLKSWTWDPSLRRPYAGYPKRQLPMWHAYRVEMYPHFGQGSGIRDQFGHELDFPAAFRLSRRTDRPKGIIKLGGLA